MSLNAKLVLKSIGHEIYPAIRKLYELYRKPYLEEIVELSEDRIQVEERKLLARIDGIEVWAKASLLLQPWSYYPASISFELFLEPGGHRPRIEARIQWDADQGPKEAYGSRLADPRVLAAFRGMGKELVQKLLARLQERRAEAEAGPEFQEALQELEALAALWGEESK